MASWILAAILGLTPIAPGASVTGTMPDGDPTTALVAYRLEGVSGPVTVEASSYDFDVRLKIVQRAGEGEAAVVAEDDDSGVATNARLTFEAAPGVLYEVEVRPTVDDWGGEFSVVVARGDAGTVSDESEETADQYWAAALSRVLSETASLSIQLDRDNGPKADPSTEPFVSGWAGSAAAFDLERLARALDGAGSLAYESGEFSDAVRAYRHTLAIRESLRPSHPHLSETQTMLGRSLFGAGQFEEALPFFEGALRSVRDAKGPDDQSTSFRLNDLAHVWCRLEQHDVAASFFEQAVRIVEKNRSDSPYDVFATLAAFGNELTHMDDWRGAAPLLSRATTIAERHRFPPDEIQAIHYRVTAAVYRRLGACEDERYYLARSVEIEEALYGAESPKRLYGLLRYGSSLYVALELDRARAVHESALAIAKAHSQTRSDTLAATALNLGTVLRAQGLYDDALRHYALAPEIYARPGSDEQDLARVEHAIGRTYLAMDEPTLALSHLEASVQTWNRLDGSGSFRLAMGRERVSEALRGVGRKKEARVEARIAKELKKTHTPPSDRCIAAEF